MDTDVIGKVIAPKVLIPHLVTIKITCEPRGLFRCQSPREGLRSCTCSSSISFLAFDCFFSDFQTLDSFLYSVCSNLLIFPCPLKSSR